MKKQEDPTKCGQCGVDARPFLHHVRHRGCFRRLCTTCVLRLHPQSFCPICFLPPLPSPSSSIPCSKCYSSSHSSCLPNNGGGGPHICQLCVDTTKALLIVKENGVDEKGARVLLAAARIAADSVGKAAAGARAEAEKRVKEAAVAKRRAKEAIEEVVGKKKEKVMVVGVRNNNSINSNNGVNVDGSVLAAFNAVELRGENAKCMEVVPVSNVEPIAVDRSENGGS